MKTSITIAFTFLFLGSTICIAQESADSQKPVGFAWLKQFEGSWVTESRSPDSSGAGAPQKATLTSRSMGSQWIVNEHRAQINGIDFDAVQTIGYDAQNKRFIGTWVDSTSSHTWHYSGNLDDSGRKLILEAEGPDWTNPSQMKLYRDIYEFQSENEIAGSSQIKNDEGKWDTFMTSTITRVKSSNASTSVAPFLLFEGEAESAINFYKTVFPDTAVESMSKYKAGENGTEGKIKVATIVIAGQRIMFTDSPIEHDFDFTPSFSFFVECETSEQLKNCFAKLSKDGKVMMPIDNYGFSKQFGWTGDKFGINWQLNLK